MTSMIHNTYQNNHPRLLSEKINSAKHQPNENISLLRAIEMNPDESNITISRSM
jgi:hypothetical protein